MIDPATVRVIILAGQRDFGRCRLASELPTPLWPVAGKPALQHILDSLADQGVTDAVVCSNGESAILANSVRLQDDLRVEFVQEALPVGTAGALRDAAGNRKDALFIVMPASMVCVPKIQTLLQVHQAGQCHLTVMFNPSDEDSGKLGRASGIYLCAGRILEHIPRGGYFDIKEGLIPEMIRAGKSVHAAILPNHSGSFRDRPEYLRAMSNYLESSAALQLDKTLFEQSSSGDVWVAKDAEVDSTAKVCGPAVIMHRAKVSSGAVVLGPAILGNNVEIGADAAVISSAVWDGAKLGAFCRVQKSLIGCRAVVGRDCIVEDESISGRCRRAFGRAIGRKLKVLGEKMGKIRQGRHDNLQGSVVSHAGKPQVLLGLALVAVAFLWCYLPELGDLWGLWLRSDEYSSGMLVPFLAIYVLWTRREQIAGCVVKPDVICGLLAFIGAQAFRFYGLFYNYRTGERISVVLSLGALVLLIFGWRTMWKVFTVLLFLFLMIPWPTPLQNNIAQPLQRYATTSAVFCLELLGYGVVQYGNTIDIGGTQVEVAWACNGLRMITAFFVISGLVVLLVKRPLWEKIVVFASSLPIALMCNTIRLTLTSIAFTMLEGEKWEEIFHDFGGYAMMPLALAAIVGELWLLKKLTTAPVQQTPIVITRQQA